ncbi:hypothetical protein AX17_002875 [Amanita inopinata Kibby_2008]|nr:hypothetical protein AX17_002875 [Amanita inopinata Kibby_2008]
MHTARFEQDVQPNPMNPSPILPDLPPTFLPNLPAAPGSDSMVQNHLLRDAPVSFSTEVTSPNGMISSMHVSMPNLPASAFMTPMEAVDSAPQLRSAPPGFISDFQQTQVDPFSLVTPLDNAISIEMSPTGHTLSASPSQSQLSSPSIHGPPTTYTVTVPSSLGSALSPPTVPNGQGQPTAPVPTSALPSNFISLGPTQQGIHLSFSNVIRQQDAAMPETEPHLILGEMLHDIAKTANSAGNACRMRQGAEATFKVDELRQRILKVSDMLSIMTVGTSNNYPAPPFPPQSSLIAVPEQHGMNIQAPLPSNSPSIDLSSHLNISDLSRKRSASDMEEQRTVKALKREPQDDFPIAHTPETPCDIKSLIFANASSANSQLPHTEPTSRPTTPPSAYSACHMIESTKQQSSLVSDYPSFLSSSQAGVDFGSGITTPLASSPTFSDFHSSWCDAVATSQHHHSLSAGSIQRVAVASTTAALSEPLGTYPAAQLSQQPTASIQVQSMAHEAHGLEHTIGRLSRSNSMGGPVDGQFNYGFLNQYADNATGWQGTTLPSSPDATAEAVSSTNWVQTLSESVLVSVSPSVSDAPSTVPSTSRNSPTDDEDEGSTSSDGADNNSHKKLACSEASASSSPGSDVPQEYKTEVDRIFFEFLNKICSNLDATDSKGEPIHQTLMAKKMQRLDESPDFRPFKFRIQAFTLAFLEELARQGYPEEKIPMKKIRNYLWRQQYILRFNEDGKKAKSKGNHIWNIEARKAGDGKWEFRPFHRKLAGNPPSVAYCGLKWSWTPRVWDPQASWQNTPVKYSSPSLPSWLSWKDDVLSGIPPPDAEDRTITVNANYVLDGQEGQLSHTFTITIAPVSAIDTTSYAQSRRPSMAGDIPRRSTSDSYLCQTAQRSKARSNTLTSTGGYTANKNASSSSANPNTAGISESPDTRVIRVLQQAAQKVMLETESQLVSGIPEKQETLDDLARQKHILEQTVDAYDKELSGQSHSQTRRLAVAAQHVVIQAAHTVIADKTGGTVILQSEVSAIQSVTVSELSDATQDAIAEAVKMKGAASNDVDIIVTATSILKARTPGSPTIPLETLPTPSNSPVTPNISSLSSSPGLGTTRSNLGSGYTPNLTSLPEYV